MNGKRAHANRHDERVNQWEAAFEKHRELMRALDEADTVLKQAGRSDLANRIFKLSPIVSLRLVYLAPPEISHALAKEFGESH